ncbi:MAG TPA: alpha-L-arabinofuranosidase C-terminal domain-containing protein [Tepidisphaeraceae bacterium]
MIRVLMEERIGRINPFLHGHFCEHLGSCIDQGIYVGEDSAIPNTAGIRDDVLEALKRLRPPILRWPGGCFADDYHWRDGVGPKQHRPRTVNLWWGHSVECNKFGTHEFLNLCRMIGAEPYLAGNIGTGSPREMRDWVEYCNFAGNSTLAALRAGNGSPLPFDVKYWGVGNEAWGCGGNFCPEDYAREYKRVATYLPDFAKCPLYLIAVGPDGNRPDWTRRFFEKLAGADRRWNVRLHGLAAHYYCGTAGRSTVYTVEQWYELLARASAIEQLIIEQRRVMDEFDPQRKVGLLVDEWGTWHVADGPMLWQQNTMRDALVAAITLDTFHRHAEKVAMANIAQVVNVLQAMILTREDRMVLTPTYHVFEMYRPHQGGEAVRMVVEGEEIDVVAPAGGAQTPPTLARLSGSASVAGDRITLSAAHTHASEPLEAEIIFDGAAFTELGVTELSHKYIHAHNTLELPNMVRPRTSQLALSGGSLRYIFPPASVTVFDVRLR